MEGEGGRVCHATDRPRSGDPLLHAGPGRLPHRGWPVHRPAARRARRKAPGWPPWLNSVTARIFARLRLRNPMPAQITNLFLLENLEDASKTKELAESDRNALRAVADWIKTFVARPHRDLGRAAPVCPFVPVAWEHKTLWLAAERSAGRKAPHPAHRELQATSSGCSASPRRR